MHGPPNILRLSSLSSLPKTITSWNFWSLENIQSTSGAGKLFIQPFKDPLRLLVSSSFSKICISRMCQRIASRMKEVSIEQISFAFIISLHHVFHDVIPHIYELHDQSQSIPFYINACIKILPDLVTHYYYYYRLL